MSELGFPKRRRIVDEELLAAVRNLPCLGCASIDPRGAYEAVHDNQIRSHPHHVISRGAGGDDVAENVMPLCVTHHMEMHSPAGGNSAMAKKYPVIKDWLISTRHLEYEE